MEIDFTRDDYRFILRTSAVIFNKEKDKVLLCNMNKKSYYLLPGGRIDVLEASNEAIKREIIEEIGWDNLDFDILAITEEFINYKEKNIQRINFIYKTVYNKEIDKLDFEGLEGDFLNFKWIDIKDLDKHNLYPEKIKDVIRKPNKIYHIIENDIIKE